MPHNYTGAGNPIAVIASNSYQSQLLRDVTGGIAPGSVWGNYGWDLLLDEPDAVSSYDLAEVVSAGPVTYYGASSATITLTGTTNGIRKTFSTSTGTIVLTGTSNGVRKTYGVSTGRITLTGTTNSLRKAIVASQGRITLTATTANLRKTYGVSTGRVTFTATTNAIIVGGVVTHYGASTATVVFTGTTLCRKKTFGLSTGTITFTGTTAPRLTVRAVSTGRITLTATTDGIVLGLLAPGYPGPFDADTEHGRADSTERQDSYEPAIRGRSRARALSGSYTSVQSGKIGVS